MPSDSLWAKDAKPLLVLLLFYEDLKRCTGELHRESGIVEKLFFFPMELLRVFLLMARIHVVTRLNGSSFSDGLTLQQHFKKRPMTNFHT